MYILLTYWRTKISYRFRYREYFVKVVSYRNRKKWHRSITSTARSTVRAFGHNRPSRS